MPKLDAKKILTEFNTALNGCLVFCFMTFLAGCATNKSSLNDPSENKSYKYLGEEPFYGKAMVHRYLLQNGLKVLILEDHSSPTFSYHTWFNVGSLDEKPGLTGLAHLFEHMMFKATKNNKDGDFMRLLDMAGAEHLNAFTSRDYTGYVQNLPSSKLEMIMGLESDRMVNLIVNQQSLDKEREVVRNEKRFRKDNSPDGTLYEALYNRSYESTHPYHWPTIGYDADLDRAKVNECYGFYQNHYAANNATIVVVGDVEHEKTMDLIHHYYGSLPVQPVDKYQGTGETIQKTEVQEVLKLPLSVEKLFMAYHVPNINHEDAAGVEMFANFFGHTKSSRLYRKLVDGGFASKVDSFYDGGKLPSLFVIVVNLQKGKKAEAALTAIDREIESIVKNGVKKTEVETALNQYKLDLFSTLGSFFSMAQQLGFLETVAGRIARGPEFMKQMEGLTSTQLQKIGKKYFSTKNRTVLIGSPKGKKI